MKRSLSHSLLALACAAGIATATGARAANEHPDDKPRPAATEAMPATDSGASPQQAEQDAPKTVRKVEQAKPEATAETAGADKPTATPATPETVAAEPAEKATAKPEADTAAPARTAAATPTPSPAKTGQPDLGAAVVYHDGDGRYCIGGTGCPHYCASPDRACKAEFSHVITLDKPTYIATVQVNAHDNIGKTRRSKLIVKVNGKELASEPVYRLGSSISLKADTVGQVITIESAHQYNGFLKGGDEAVLWDVFVFGEPK